MGVRTISSSPRISRILTEGSEKTSGQISANPWQKERVRTFVQRSALMMERIAPPAILLTPPLARSAVVGDARENTKPAKIPYFLSDPGGTRGSTPYVPGR